jgi:hypothetical protein
MPSRQPTRRQRYTVWLQRPRRQSLKPRTQSLNLSFRLVYPLRHIRSFESLQPVE